MPIKPTTPAGRITRLLKEGASFVAIQRGEPGGVDVTHDIIGLLEAAREAPVTPAYTPEEAFAPPLH